MKKYLLIRLAPIHKQWNIMVISAKTPESAERKFRSYMKYDIPEKAPIFCIDIAEINDDLWAYVLN